MTKATIFCFSATGNTRKAVAEYEKAFSALGITTEVRNVNYTLSDFSTDADMLGLAYPIHGFNASKNVIEAVKSFPKAENKKLFIIKTSGEPLKLNNISSGLVVKILKKKGYVLTNEYHYAMPYNMIFRHEDGMASLMYKTMRDLIPCHAEEIASGKERKLDKVFCGRLIAWIFRIEHWFMPVNGKLFKVDKTKCVGCKKCVNICPQHNIKFDNGNIKFENKCLGCTACSFSCPTGAINIGILNGWKVNGQYNFNAEPARQSGKHSEYCKKAYDRYFAEAESEIKEYTRRHSVKDNV